jgi:hypothetical protein
MHLFEEYAENPDKFKTIKKVDDKELENFYNCLVDNNCDKNLVISKLTITEKEFDDLFSELIKHGTD